jgi:serine/threonine protein kinase
VAELRTHQDLTGRGETAIVGALLSLGSAFCVLPHLVVPGKAWPEAPDDLDVIVFGPGGLALLAYHHWQGVVEASRGADKPWRIRFPGGGAEVRANPADVLGDKVQTLVDFLSERGVAPPNLSSALVFPDRTKVDGDPGVPITDTRRVADWVTAHVGSGSDPTWPRRAADQVRPPSPARLVNQYQITSLLRRDGDRQTYLAYDTLGAKPVLLRELFYDPYLAPEKLEKVRQELLREAKLTMELDHPNVVRVERVIPKDDRYYVVSEWIDSCQSLRERMEQGGLPLPQGEALDIAIQVAAALAQAHARGIIHRDVRPESVLVAPGVVKITKFGLAKKADAATRPTFDLRKMATESPYAAPEFRIGQDGHHQVDARADLFSLGAMLYEMLTGQLPGHLDEKYWEPPSQFARDLPPGLDEVLAKALKFDPAQRFSTATALRERLLHVRDRLPDHPDTPRVRYAERKLVRRTQGSLIYQATDRKLQKFVALKRLLVDPGLGADARKATLDATLREASIASRLAHPGIVHMLDHFVEDDDGYLVMEWLPGASLRETMDKAGGKRLPLEQALDVVSQVGEALNYAQGEGVIHRDVKPENVMIHGNRAILLDFGIAAGLAALDPPEPRTAPKGRGATHFDGDRFRNAGTARYIAPEALRGQEADVRSDLFSLGVMAYELLTGRYPYPAQTILARYDTGMLSEGVAAPATLNLEVTSQLSSAIMRAIAPDPAGRFADMAEFLDALAVARGRKVKASPAEWRARFMRAGLSVALGVAVAGGLFFMLRPYLSRAPKQPSALLETPSPATESVALFAGTATDGALEAAAVVASALLPEPTPTAEATPPPTPTPVPATPRPTAPPKVTWMSSAQAVGGVTLEVVTVEPALGRTVVTLRIRNDTADDVRLLGQDGSIQIADSKGADYSGAMDYGSVAPELMNVSGGHSAEARFSFRRGVDPEADGLTFVVKEDGGIGRIWNLRAHRLVGE